MKAGYITIVGQTMLGAIDYFSQGNGIRMLRRQWFSMMNELTVFAFT